MNVIKFLTEEKKFYGDLTTFEEEGGIRDHFKKSEININYSEDGPQNRFIFSTTKKFRNSGDIDEYVSESNGLVLLAPLLDDKGFPIKGENWKILAYPPETYKSNIPKALIDPFIHTGVYEVYHIEEGTIISLYYFAGKWRMSSANGIDMGDVVWDRMTFKESFNECLWRYGLTFESFTDRLKKGNSYTFGFKHPERHPFYGDSPIYKIWLVKMYLPDEDKHVYGPLDEKQIEEYKSICDLSGSEDVKIKDATPETNKTLSIQDATPKTKTKSPAKYKKYDMIHQQKLVDTKSIKGFNCHYLFKSCADSLSDYENKKIMNYGYILRSRDSNKTHGYNSILFESRLLKYIRQLYYQVAFSTNSQALNILRPDYILLTWYLKSNISQGFIQMFPQFKPEFAIFEKIKNNLFIIMYNMYKEDDKKSPSKKSSDKSQIASQTYTDLKPIPSLKDKQFELYKKIAISFKNRLSEKTTIDIRKDYSKQFILQFLLDTSNLNGFHKLWNIHRS